MKELEEGDVIELNETHTVYANIPEHFAYSNKKGSFKLTKTSVTLKGEMNYLCGKYIVIKTVFDGGSTGRDAYPNGHHVFCASVNDSSVKVDFYQSGCFTAMIEDIKPIGKAELKWSIAI